MKLPLGKRGLLAAAALTGAVVYWRVRQQREEAEREWADDIANATDEGMEAAHASENHRDEV